MLVRIFTDGACSENPGPGGWGAVFYKPSGQDIISGHEFETTNNRMELTAFVKALEKIQEEHEVDNTYELYSDSAYVVNAVNLTDGLDGLAASVTSANSASRSFALLLR